MTITATRLTPFPWFVTRAAAGCVNAAPWRDAGAREWLCTNASYEPDEDAQRRGRADAYAFRFEFMRNVAPSDDQRAVDFDEITGAAS